MTDEALGIDDFNLKGLQFADSGAEGHYFLEENIAGRERFASFLQTSSKETCLVASSPKRGIALVSVNVRQTCVEAASAVCRDHRQTAHRLQPL